MAKFLAPTSETKAKPCASWKLQTAIMYPLKPGAKVDARFAYTVPVATLGVTNAAAGAVDP